MRQLRQVVWSLPNPGWQGRRRRG